MKTRLEPKVLQWARQRAGLDEASLALKVIGRAGRADDVREWETTGELTFRRAELIAEKTHTPFGLLFLKQPPQERLPIRDFRTVGGQTVQTPTPELLDVIYQCQRRQAWFRNHLITSGNRPLDFVGCVNITYPIGETAEKVRTAHKIGPGLSSTATSWTQNLALHFEAIEDSGVLLMRNGIVGNNVYRKLSVDVFRGFALCDEYAPLIFVNTRDSVAAQLFTLVHELVHIWIGESALSNPVRSYVDGGPMEAYCNTVAAEVLVPMVDFKRNWRRSEDPVSEIKRLSSKYKVSTLVIARRSKDAGILTDHQFKRFYDEQAKKYQNVQRPGEGAEGGGNFHNSLIARAGRRFCRALLAATLEGRTTYKEALGLLDLTSSNALHGFARAKMGYSVE